MFRRVLLVVLVSGSLSLTAGAAPASLGSAFAETFTAFAPLFALHQSYAGYLLLGSEVAVPPGLDGVCDVFVGALPDLVAEFRVQSGSCVLEALSVVGGLREKSLEFCQSYSDQIETIARMEDVDLVYFSQAAESGFFKAIMVLNESLQEAFGLGLNCFESAEGRWRFGAAFVTRTLLCQETVERIDVSLKAILLGSEETPAPPKDLPLSIREASESLAALSGKPLNAEEAGEAKALAERIHVFLLEDR